MSDFEPAPIQWLWPNRIAVGKLTMLVGDPGQGKSLLTIDLAARISRGLAWPEAVDEAPIGSVVMLSAEDDMADTIRPRLDAAGADPRKVFCLATVEQRDPETGHKRRAPFCLATDLPPLERAIESTNDCRMVIIDPMTAFLGGRDDHRNAEIRGILAPLAEMAARQKVAVVAVSHFNKTGGQQALHRAIGSLAFVAASRAVWAVVTDQQTATRRLLLPLKSNLSPDRSGLAFEFAGRSGTPTLAWELSPVTMSADEALKHENREEQGEREAAEEWLREALADGPVAAKDIQRAASENGVHKRTLRRALKAIGGESHKTGMGGGWEWSLPAQQDKGTEGDHT